MGDGVRDLRGLLWSSIDNDDSRDLDQLEAAEPLPGGAVRLLVAIADVDALVREGTADRRPRADEHHLGLHGRRDLPDAAGALLHRPDLARTRARSGWRSWWSSRSRPDGEVEGCDVYRALVLNKAKLAYGGVGAWLEGTAAAALAGGGGPGLDEQLRVQDRAATAMRSLRHAGAP